MSADERFIGNPLRILSCNSKGTPIKVGHTLVQPQGQTWTSALAYNPCSNLRLGSGVAPVRKMIENGIVVGVGTDASGTSDGQNMFEATRLASYLSRIDGPATEKWSSASDALQLATEGSAKVLGFEKIGNWRLDMRRTSCSCGWTVLTLSRCALR